MSDFNAGIERLVIKELVAAQSDPDRLAGMMECLLRAVALAIAVGVRGNAKGADTMLEGMTAYLYEATAERSAWAAKLAGDAMRPAPRSPS